jgi:putative hydrolase
VTAQVVVESLAGEEPVYLRRVETLGQTPVDEGAAALRAALRGDCHTHSDWSDGGSPIDEMARTARELGHEYVVLTDHSPRLTVANGLSPERLREQLDVVARLNDVFAAEAQAGAAAPFRLLTGIECDILEDGSLDQEPALLARLDVVVASVHSKLRMARDEMTARMVAAISNPHTDVLGHCTGRQVVGHGRGGKGRPESEFDAELVFAACARFDVAVEVNSRPSGSTRPSGCSGSRSRRAAGCRSTPTRTRPGQLAWQHLGLRAGLPVRRDAGPGGQRRQRGRAAQLDGRAGAARDEPRSPGREHRKVSSAARRHQQRAAASRHSVMTPAARGRGRRAGRGPAGEHGATALGAGAADQPRCGAAGEHRGLERPPRRLGPVALGSEGRSTRVEQRAPGSSWQRASGQQAEQALTVSDRGPRSGSPRVRVGKTLRHGAISAVYSPRARTGGRRRRRWRRAPP